MECCESPEPRHRETKPTSNVHECLTCGAIEEVPREGQEDSHSELAQLRKEVQIMREEFNESSDTDTDSDSEEGGN